MIHVAAFAIFAIFAFWASLHNSESTKPSSIAKHNESFEETGYTIKIGGKWHRPLRFARPASLPASIGLSKKRVPTKVVVSGCVARVGHVGSGCGGLTQGKTRHRRPPSPLLEQHQRMLYRHMEEEGGGREQKEGPTS